MVVLPNSTWHIFWALASDFGFDEYHQYPTTTEQLFLYIVLSYHETDANLQGLPFPLYSSLCVKENTRIDLFEFWKGIIYEKFNNIKFLF